eukprot:344913-Pelagomonas_calceolata.AAC.10
MDSSSKLSIGSSSSSSSQASAPRACLQQCRKHASHGLQSGVKSVPRSSSSSSSGALPTRKWAPRLTGSCLPATASVNPLPPPDGASLADSIKAAKGDNSNQE